MLGMPRSGRRSRNVMRRTLQSTGRASRSQRGDGPHIMRRLLNSSKTFENPPENNPYKILFGFGDYTCSVARWTGTNTGPFMGPDGRMIPATNRKFELEFCTVAHWK